MIYKAGRSIMRKDSYQATQHENVILAPEGFLDRRHLPFIRNNDVSIIEVRMLADGPMIHTIRLHPSFNAGKTD